MEHEDRLRTLVRTIRETCNVSAGARVAGVSRKTAYQWYEESKGGSERHRLTTDDGDETTLHEAWDDALGGAVEDLELEDRRCAMGHWEPQFHQGAPVWEVDPITKDLRLDDNLEPIQARKWVYDNQARERQLKAHAPEKYRERVDVKHGGKVEGGLVVLPAMMTVEEWKAKMAAKKKAGGV